MQKDLFFEKLRKEFSVFHNLSFEVEDFIDQIKDLGPEKLSKVGFCIITPDSIIRNVFKEIIDDLEMNNVKILDYKIRYLNSREVEEIYKYGFSEKIILKQKTHWWLTEKSFTIGPAIILLVFYDKNNEEFAYEHLLKIKGKSLPSKNTYGIRFKYSSISKILNLFHSSDNMACVFREANIFWKINDIKKLVCEIEHKHFYTGEWIEKALNIEGTNNNGFLMLLVLKRRILYEIIHRNEDKKNYYYLKKWDILYKKYVKLYNKNNDYKTKKELLKFFLSEEEVCGIKEILKKIQKKEINLSNLFSEKISLTLGLIYVFFILSDEGRYANIIFSDIEKILKINNIFITPWEKIAIENTLFFYNS